MARQQWRASSLRVPEMKQPLTDLSRELGAQAEAVCRHYLSNGRRAGNYWVIGDVCNTPGQSMFVRLTGTARGPAGRWTDAATGQFGDLLDVIRESLGLVQVADAAEEARNFLGAPPTIMETLTGGPGVGSRRGSREAARRLAAIAGPIRGTLVESYPRGRGIAVEADLPALRFHPRCYYFAGEDRAPDAWPAMIGVITDLRGAITGVHRTWLDPDGFDPRRLGKANVETPRRAMGDLLGHAVRFGLADDVLAVGEGIETVLSVKSSLPGMPMAAALSAAHLAALDLPTQLRRLYILRDNDAAGQRAGDVLAQRAAAAGVEHITLAPSRNDFNEDLRLDGLPQLHNALRYRLIAADVERFDRR
jgi:hypothetical protein